MLRPSQIRQTERWASIGGAVLLSVVVAGCSSGSSGTAAAAGTPNPTASGQSGPGGAGSGGNPGVSGVISQVSGSTLTATSSQGTTSKVSWTSGTRVSSQTTGAASDVVSGACVSVRRQFSRGGQMPSGRPSGSGQPTGMPSRGAGGAQPSFTVPSSVTATAVTILPSGECTASTASTSSSSASGGRGFGGGFGGLTGTVSSVSGSGFVFKTTGNGGKSVTATTTSSTTYTKQSTATAAAIQAGKCVEARGRSTNSVLAATSITVSESVNGECTFDTGGFGDGVAPGGGSNGSAGNAS